MRLKFDRPWPAPVRPVTQGAGPIPESMVMQQNTPRPFLASEDPSTRRWIERFARGLIPVTALLLGLPNSAVAAQRSYYIHFQASPSPSALGYMIHLGDTSGEYLYSVDIGSPPTQTEEIVYSATLDDSLDHYFALTTYDALGNSSGYSNEIMVAAATAAPPPPPPSPDPQPDPDPEPEPAPDPDPQPTPDPEPTPNPLPGVAGARLGITGDASGLVRTILEDGSLTDLTLDSLASNGDLRPARCDLDSDGDGDLVVGFGPGSNGQIALIYLEQNAVVSVDSIRVGDPAYHQADGQTYPACGDVDGDGRPELVVGMGADFEEVLQVLDDHDSGFAAYSLSTSAQGRLSVPVTSRIANLGSALVPTLGDIDGDGRDELVVGFARSGVRSIAILDDGLAEFAGHPRVNSSVPLIRVARPNWIDSKGGGTFPALGDWDGDGLAEIAVGFGEDSDGWVAFLDDAERMEFDRYSSFLVIPVGREAHRSGEGSARPAFGNIDDDPAEELIVGFGGDHSHELQVFDDLVTGGMDALRGGLGFVTSSDPDSTWVPSPAR